MITKSMPVRQSRSTLPGSTELPGAQRTIPRRALGLSVAALAAAMWGAFSSPDILAGYDAVSWLLLLVPVFLFSYYRGWQGATRALAVGSLMIIVSTGALFVLGIEVEWFFLLLVAAVLVAVGIGLGILSELLERERLQALALAYGDPVTGLPNRRLVDFMLDKEFAAGQRGGRPHAVVLFDVDGLKAYNARYGKAAGDEALQLIATQLNENTRRMNTTGRYYGDKFVSVLSGETRDDAWAFAERARDTIAGVSLPTRAKLTVSIGIAPGNPSARDPEEGIKAAAKAVSHAKSLGGNCSVCAGEY